MQNKRNVPPGKQPKGKYTGTFPPSLRIPNRKLYDRAMFYMDLLQDGIRAENRIAVETAHDQIRRLEHDIKNCCPRYRYAAPDPEFPDHWDTVCMSDAKGKFWPGHNCRECKFFDDTCRLMTRAQRLAIVAAKPSLVQLGRPQ